MRFWKRLRQYFPFQSKRIIYGEITLLTLLCLLLLCQSGGSPRAVLSTALRLAAGPDASGSGASDASPHILPSDRLYQMGGLYCPL